MSRYFKVFKFDKDNVFKSPILEYPHNARIFLPQFLNAPYDFRNGNFYIASE